jgi:hypothetical protein
MLVTLPLIHARSEYSGLSRLAPRPDGPGSDVPKHLLPTDISTEASVAFSLRTSANESACAVEKSLFDPSRQHAPR